MPPPEEEPPIVPSRRSRLRIALVIRRLLDVGGAQRQLRILGTELARRGHRVTILTERVAHIQPPERCRGLPVVSIPSIAVRWLGSFVYTLRLCYHLLSWRRHYDVVEVFLMKHSALGAVLARLMGGPPVVIRPACAGPPGDLFPLRRRPLWRRVMHLCRRADAFVALSDDLVEELVAFGCPRERIHRIPSGMVVAEGGFPPPSSCGPTVLFVGRLDAQKGLPVLLRAFAGVVEHLSGARLVLLGDGPQRALLEAEVRRLGLSGVVEFAGVVRGVEDYLKRSRLFVLPSLAEGMSSALLEAMAAGRAVVATRVSGSSELVIDGECGLLVEPGNPARLAEAILRLLLDDALADRLGQAARLRVLRDYSAEQLARAHEDLFHRLLDPTSPGAVEMEADLPP